MKSWDSGIIGVIAFFLALFGTAYGLIFLEQNLDSYVWKHFVPSATNMVLFFVCLWMLTLIENPLMKLFFFLWTVWFVAGTFNIIGSYFKNRLIAPVYVEEANNIYLFAIIALGLGVNVFERLIRKSQALKKNVKQVHDMIPISFASMIALLVFPFVYFLSVFSTIGRIPILSGVSIIDSIYEIYYGPLYGAKIVLLLSMTLAFLLIWKSSPLIKFLLVAYVLFVMFVSVMDGKRITVLAAFIVAMSMSIRTQKSSLFNPRILTFAGLAVALYVVVKDIRSMTVQQDESGGLVRLMTVTGDEYRAYVHSINYFSREWIGEFGYDWVKSTVASLVNRNILSAFGISKDDWIQLDSARTWMKAYQDRFGIRTGIVSELWYAFGYGLFPIMLLSGPLLSIFSRALWTIRSERNYIFLRAAYGILTLSIMGQTTSIVGALVTLSYLWVILYVLEKIIPFHLFRRRTGS